jgi:hypothetical protein
MAEAVTIQDLHRYDRETPCRRWCDLNAFRWPGDFPGPEPPGWAGMDDRARHESAEGRRAWRDREPLFW